MEFTDYILNLWKKIGYSPQNLEIGNEIPEEPVEDAGGSFTPVKPAQRDEVFAGVTIKQIPRDTDRALVTELLCWAGLPADKTEEIMFKPNGAVTVKNLENVVCQALIIMIHGNENFGKK